MPVSPLCSVFSTSAQVVVPNAKASIFIWFVPVVLRMCDARLFHGSLRPILRGGMRRGEAGAAGAEQFFAQGALVLRGLLAAAPGQFRPQHLRNILQIPGRDRARHLQSVATLPPATTPQPVLHFLP